MIRPFCSELRLDRTTCRATWAVDSLARRTHTREMRKGACEGCWSPVLTERAPCEGPRPSAQ